MTGAFDVGKPNPISTRYRNHGDSQKETTILQPRVLSKALDAQIERPYVGSIKTDYVNRTDNFLACVMCMI